MKADLLHAVTCYFNPVRWESRQRWTSDHLTHLLDTGCRPTLVECQTGERPFQFTDFPHINHVAVRSKTLLWNKENLLNIGISRLPDPDWKYVAWTDADIYFRKPDWAVSTVYALQQYDVIQPWSDAYDLGPDDSHLNTFKSFLNLWWNGKSVVYGVDPQQTAFEKRIHGISPPSAHVTHPVQISHPGHTVHNGIAREPTRVETSIATKPNNHGAGCCCPICVPVYCPPSIPYYGLAEPRTASRMPWWTRDGGKHEYPHTGYAWAATRHAIDSVGGLFDLAAFGAGDYHMALALIGYADRSIPKTVNESYRKHLMEWQDRAVQHLNYNYGYIQGTIEHHFHGAKGNRRYIDRWQIILEHDFDPDIDIQRNAQGVIELRCTKPKLRHDLDVYMKQRNEDANSIA